MGRHSRVLKPFCFRKEKNSGHRKMVAVFYASEALHALDQVVEDGHVEAEARNRPSTVCPYSSPWSNAPSVNSNRHTNKAESGEVFCKYRDVNCLWNFWPALSYTVGEGWDLHDCKTVAAWGVSGLVLCLGPVLKIIAILVAYVVMAGNWKGVSHLCKGSLGRFCANARASQQKSSLRISYFLSLR